MNIKLWKLLLECIDAIFMSIELILNLKNSVTLISSLYILLSQVRWTRKFLYIFVQLCLLSLNYNADFQTQLYYNTIIAIWIMKNKNKTVILNVIPKEEYGIVWSICLDYITVFNFLIKLPTKSIMAFICMSPHSLMSS